MDKDVEKNINKRIEENRKATESLYSSSSGKADSDPVEEILKRNRENRNK